jgi:glutathione S-transferase
MSVTPAPLRLYELVLADGRSASPYVWRIRYALAHKGLPYESVPVGFTDIPGIAGGRFKTVPVLEHGATMLAESWDIAAYLDATFRAKPLFSGPAEIAMVKLFESWMLVEIVRRMVGIYILDVHDAARPQDRAYFRRSREARFNGKRLEEITAGREQRLPALREAFAPMRAHLANSRFLGGDSPNYADYIALASCTWVASVATLPLFPHDDVLRGWLERGFALPGSAPAGPLLQALFEPTPRAG